MKPGAGSVCAFLFQTPAHGFLESIKIKHIFKGSKPHAMQKKEKYFRPECETVEVRVERTVCESSNPTSKYEGVKWNGDYE